jgi:hypothetical protein
MASMMMLIYIAAAGTAIALRSQAKRERGEIALECAQRAITIPRSGPKIRTLESILTIAAGMVLLFPALTWIALLVRRATIGGDGTAEMTGIPGMMDYYIFLLAAGLTLVILGGAALVQNMISSRAPCSGVSASGRHPGGSRRAC